MIVSTSIHSQSAWSYLNLNQPGTFYEALDEDHEGWS